jgi:hypothetical protein
MRDLGSHPTHSMIEGSGTLSYRNRKKNGPHAELAELAELSPV